MPPPEGAWMTRDGNDMEIGCHNGAKVWTLSCQDNQWVGAIGQCGVNLGLFLTHVSYFKGTSFTNKNNRKYYTLTDLGKIH